MGKLYIYLLSGQDAADLRPVAEDLSVAAVSDELVRELCHAVVEVVHDHVHHGRRVPADRRVRAHRVRSTTSLHSTHLIFFGGGISHPDKNLQPPPKRLPNCVL